LAAVSGIAFALATPPVDLTPLVWLGLAGLAYALGAASPPAKDTPLARACAGGGRGLAFGIGVNVFALRFVPTVIARFTPLPWAVGVVALLLLACAQALAWWVAGVVRVQLVTRARLPAWVAFAIGVYAATFVPQIFPWTPAGAIATWPTMLQLADAIGERGVSMLLAVSAGLIAEAARGLREKNREHATEIRRRSLISGVSAIALPHVMALYGASRAASVEEARAAAPSAQVALVQPSIGATERWES